jgi:SAM-dependent methyltransferase
MNKISRADHNWLAHKMNNESLARHLDSVSGVVIDLGCGTAPYKEDILPRASQYVGLDWPQSWHGNMNVDVCASLTRELPFRDGCTDTVVSFQVMEHLPEPVLFLGECYRLLKNGGRLLLTVPLMWQIHEAPHDYYRYTRYGLNYLLTKTGFSDVRIEEESGFWQMWGLKFNYYSKYFARGPVRCALIPLWWLIQTVTPMLDRYDPRPSETTGYIVVAEKR